MIKTFEEYENDHNYKVGDWVELLESKLMFPKVEITSISGKKLSYGLATVKAYMFNYKGVELKETYRKIYIKNIKRKLTNMQVAGFKRMLKNKQNTKYKVGDWIFPTEPKPFEPYEVTGVRLSDKDTIYELRRIYDLFVTSVKNKNIFKKLSIEEIERYKIEIETKKYNI